jgi:pimeloyl-ACP methyl ester carboxylesterase
MAGDGMRLFWREWPGASRLTLLAIPALTRNSRDFAGLAQALPGWRLLAPDLRGRGDSDWADGASYRPEVYLDDMASIIAAASPGRLVLLGSGLGGQLALALAPRLAGQLAGLVLNDAAPELVPAGLARLAGNVGRTGNWPTWMHAARDLAARNGAVHPDWQLADWLECAKRLCCLSPSGRVVFDYDARIADRFRSSPDAGGPALWDVLAGLAVPVLALRGALSDVVDAATLARCQAVQPRLAAVTVPRVGHAPTLAEPVARTALAKWLDALVAGA